MEPYQVGLAGFLFLLALIALRMPVAFALGLVGTGGLILLRGVGTTASLLPASMFSYVTTFSFTAVPLFLLMGEFAFRSGLVTTAYEAARVWLSRLPGGLALATVTGCAMFGACSGSGVSASAAMGRLTIPEMLQRGYDSRLASGSVASAATIAVLVPPSIILVLYALFTEQSLGLLFLAAYVPGLLSIVLYLGMILLRVGRNPQLAPPVTERISWRQRFAALGRAWGIVVLFAIIIGGIYFGIVAPTEAAALAALTAFVLMLVHGKLNWPDFRSVLLDTARLSGMLFLILIGASIFGSFITVSGLPGRITGWIVGLDLPVTVVLILICVGIIALGAFMDAISMMLLVLPVLLPVFHDLGVDLIWFGIVFVKLVEIGATTPPFGITVYVVKGAIGDLVELDDIFRGIWWFLLADLVVVAVLIAFPGIITWVPDLVRSR